MMKVIKKLLIAAIAVLAATQFVRAEYVVDTSTTPPTYKWIGPPLPTPGISANDATNICVGILVDDTYVVPSPDTMAVPFSIYPVSLTATNGSTLTVTGNWPETKPVFVKVTVNGSYSVESYFTRLGTNEWPTSSWQGTVWRIGQTYYANVISVLTAP